MRDPLQEAWRDQSEGVRVTADHALLVRELRRSQRYLDQLILLRDCREVGVALMLIVAWFAMEVMLPTMLWTWYLSVPAFIWMTVFMLVFRHWYGRSRCRADDALLVQVREGIRQLEDQIWLLSHVLWWYLLPPALAGSVWVVHLGVDLSDAGVWESVVLTAMMLGLFVGVDVWVYWINQVAIRKDLEPRREELVAMLRELDPEAEEGAAEGDRTRFGVGGFLLMLLVVCGVSAVVVPVGLAATAWARGVVWGAPVEVVEPVWEEGAVYPRVSPFEAVRWLDEDSEVPQVMVGGVWYWLGSIDMVGVDELVSFSQATFKERWRKRIEEDLVVVMSGMGHRPGATVMLRLISVDSMEFKLLKAVAMTEENRQRIKEAAREREAAALAEPVVDEE